MILTCRLIRRPLISRKVQFERTRLSETGGSGDHSENILIRLIALPPPPAGKNRH